MSPATPSSGGQLPANLLLFARALRAAGLRVGTGRVLDALAAVEAVGLGSRDDFYWALHAVFVARASERPLFDQAFHVFWRNPKLLDRLRALALPATDRDASKPLSRRVADALAGLSPGLGDVAKREDVPEHDAADTWSAEEVLAEKDFESMSAGDLAAARAAMARMALKLAPVRQRRRRPHPRGSRIDFRQSLRHTLRAGGDAIALVRTRAGERPPPLVILCDISGSMSRYARVLLHFAHALTNDRDRVFSFVFGTRLTHVTRHLRERDVDVALERLGAVVSDWDGGTRIGACLHAFNRDWSRRVLGTGAVVLFITDGLNRDAGDGLEREMARLHRASARLICLNPLLRYDGYQPRTRGMRAILPHVDEFSSIHNLKSLADLVDALASEHAPSGRGVQRWLSMVN